MDAKLIWQTALERIRTRVSPGAFATWFRDSIGCELDMDRLLVGVNNTFASEHLTQRFHEVARVAASEAAGRSLRIQFVVRSAPAVTPSPQAPIRSVRPPPSVRRTPLAQRAEPMSRPAPRRPDLRAAEMSVPGVTLAQPPLLSLTPVAPLAQDPGVVAKSEATAPVATHASERQGAGDELQPRYQFESFVVGAANLFAFAAAQEVAGTPGKRYNPLLIYGGVGLGKTHLLNAIGHQVRAAGRTVAYLTAERFTNEIIEAIRLRTTHEFRQRYRAVDVLLVDDVQFIAGKDATEEEFFHTFNTLHEQDKQIVLSSDRVPNAMSHLHDRLRSRFSWGLIADIAPPDYEHRLAILRAKAKTNNHGVELADEVLEMLAQPACESIRALEGVLTRVLAYGQVLGQPVDATLARRALAALELGQSARPRVGSEEVLATVSRHYGLSVEDLRGKSRRPQVAWARQVAMYLLREETEHSLFQIGERLGGRDHTTVMHGCAKVGHSVEASTARRREIEAVRSALRP
jgi:chromosomal replication initiator protein